MKKQLLFFVVLCLAFTTKAQISDRENDESTYLLGARPEAGNFGFFLGLSTDDITALTDNTWNESGIPLINVKHYYTDKLVLKAGVQVWKKRRSIDGEMDPDNNSGINSYKHVETDANWNFILGAEKHFDLSNIIDGYIGVNGNLGYERSVRTHNESYDGGDYNNREGSSFGLTYGVETVIGSNFFVADLPVSIGFEAGFSAKNYGANKYKYDWEEMVGGDNNSGTIYTSLIDDFDDPGANNPGQFTELKARRFDIMPIARVTFTYYLKR